jgi:sialic acid synthase SpsE/quercetin dioxygenase-like cupin family protein
MEEKFDFNNLFVLDLANNHQGDVPHALNIIQSLSSVVKQHGVRAGIKFQFRNLDTFIHPSHKKGSDNKHIPRFISTRLNEADYRKLYKEVKKQGLLTICTPFDEESVELIENMDFDIIKIASCSAKDWSLLERVAATNKPVIASTGGMSLADIDNLVSFFEHRGVDYALMYCVSIYPIPEDEFNLNQIRMFKDRYPGRVIGWSTHENPDATIPVQIAVSEGARMFERHVGMETDDIKLNAYSSTPEQVDKWISAYKESCRLCGTYDRKDSAPIEIESIDSLRRGVYAKESIAKGDTISRDDVYFAMPYIDGQLDSGHWQKEIVVKKDFKQDEPVNNDSVLVPPPSEVLVLKTAVHEVKALLNQAHIMLNSEFSVEYSHHHGVDKFREIGAVIINCINREYCKKIIVQLPGQQHPSHFHKRKEETFQLLYGELHVEVDGHHQVLLPGDTQLIMPGVWHKFWTETGAVFEEVSTTHYNDDSYYKDKMINRQGRSARKTEVEHWGRFQLVDYID